MAITKIPILLKRKDKLIESHRWLLFLRTTKKTLAWKCDCHIHRTTPKLIQHSSSKPKFFKIKQSIMKAIRSLGLVETKRNAILKVKLTNSSLIWALASWQADPKFKKFNRSEGGSRNLVWFVEKTSLHHFNLCSHLVRQSGVLFCSPVYWIHYSMLLYHVRLSRSLCSDSGENSFRFTLKQAAC